MCSKEFEEDSLVQEVVLALAMCQSPPAQLRGAGTKLEQPQGTPRTLIAPKLPCSSCTPHLFQAQWAGKAEAGATWDTQGGFYQTGSRFWLLLCPNS